MAKKRRYIYIRYDNLVVVSDPHENREEFIRYTQLLRKKDSTFVKVSDNESTNNFSWEILTAQDTRVNEKKRS